MKHSLFLHHWRLSSLILGLLVGLVAGGDASLATTTPTPLAIYQAPLTVAIPAHPQVVIAVGNSESMDGNLTGAILTGSGSLGSALSELQSTAVPAPAIAPSPVNFIVPVGFTPPISGGAVGSSQPYTVQVNGNEVDNSPSRMNLAKIGLISIITNFAANTDFALIDYATAAPTAGTDLGVLHEPCRVKTSRWWIPCPRDSARFRIPATRCPSRAMRSAPPASRSLPSSPAGASRRIRGS